MQDEIFHVPMTQRYCKGNFMDWDPKITTFPGLYFLGAPYARAVHSVQRLLPGWAQEAACSTTVLRSLNILFAAAFFSVFQLLYRKLQPYTSTDFSALMVSWHTPLQYYLVQ